MSKIIPLEVKQKYAPYTMVKWYGRDKELISFPFYVDYNSDTNNEIHIMIRDKDNPCTLQEVDLREVEIPLPPKKKSWFAILPPWKNLGCFGVRAGRFYADVFIHPYFGLFMNYKGKKRWYNLRKLRLNKKGHISISAISLLMLGFILLLFILMLAQHNPDLGNLLRYMPMPR